MRSKRQLRILCAVALGVIGAPAPTIATYPTIDIGNIYQNSVSAVENRLQSAELMRQTVEMARQLAALHQIYTNAQNLYASVGNAVDSVRNFNTRHLVRSWTQPITWRNLGQTLNRWGIRPADTGPLARTNDALFGKGSFGGDLNQNAQDITRLMRTAPYTFSRDRFIRRIVDGVNEQRENKIVEEVAPGQAVAEGGGDEQNKSTWVVRKRTSEGHVSVPFNRMDYADHSVAVADAGMAEFALYAEEQFALNRQDEEIWAEHLERTMALAEQGDLSDLDQMELMLTANLLAGMQVKKLNEQIEMEATVATQRSQSTRAQIDLMQAMLDRDAASSAVQSAMGE